MPHFDSPSVFGAILDDRKGGYFSLAPAGECQVKQMYLPNTNVLVTRFFSDDGMAEVIDFMSIGQEAGGETRQEARQLVRIAKAIRGPIRFRLECRPAFDYARQKAELQLIRDGRIAIFETPQEQLVLKSERALRRDGDGVVSEFELGGEEEAVFVLRHQTGRGGEDLTGEKRGWRGAAERDGEILARLGRPEPLSRPLARDGDALGAGAETPDLSADGSDRGGPHHEFARSGRWRTQLGLSLHVGAGRGVFGLFADAPGLHRRGRGVRVFHAGTLERGVAGRRAAQRDVRHRRSARPAARRPSSIWRATADRGRCVSATPHPGTCNWISTAS